MAVRPAGSTLKPWIYYFALNKGFNPQDRLDNGSIEFLIPVTATSNKRFRPQNYSSGLNGPLAFYLSLIHSQNIGTYNLIKQPKWGSPDWRTNLDELREFFKQTNIYPEPMYEVPIMLGAQDITLEKLASSFSFFANGSHIVNPQYIKYVTDYKGQNLYEMQPEFQSVPVYKKHTVFRFNLYLLKLPTQEQPLA